VLSWRDRPVLDARGRDRLGVAVAIPPVAVIVANVASATDRRRG